MMRRLAFFRDTRGASAAEFALVVPVMLIFLLGIIDVGRYVWNVNQVEKATQVGARWAVATDIIPGGDVGCSDTSATTRGLRCYSYSIQGSYGQGEVVQAADFPPVTCSSTGSTLACTCSGCPFDTSIDANAQAAYNALVTQMNRVYGALGAQNVDVTYSYSGLGYAGDPYGSDVDPIVTVTTTDIPFRPLFLGGLANLGLPPLSYSLTMEDGQGSYSNY